MGCGASVAHSTVQVTTAPVAAAPPPAALPPPQPPGTAKDPRWYTSRDLADAISASVGLSPRGLAEAAQVLSSCVECSAGEGCTTARCRFRHGADDTLLFVPNPALPLTSPATFKATTAAPLRENDQLLWQLFGAAFERVGPDAFAAAAVRHAAALQHFASREGARMVCGGLHEPDELQSFALARVHEVWGNVVHRKSCQEYLDRSAEQTVSRVTGGEYSAPSRREVRAWPGPQGAICISRIIKVGLRNPNVEFGKKRDTAWHGCQARSLEDWRGEKNTHPQFRLEKSQACAHGSGIYVTPAFEHAVGYAFRRWDRSPRFASMKTRAGERWNYITIMQLAIYDRGDPGAVEEKTKTWAGLPGDGWDASRLEWVVRDVSKAQIYGILFCFFPNDPPQD
eukprot:NODE_6007_length_1713_cov_3.201765.p1 GENE.NODE_6007_length_1713_cov_3.201765~~NODE_6007_length_1713_cov_3.201765.p1  ORF type:complete len:397 (-),score=110.30 NODE_6007_length_1713_cov_3.201765:458-1648(-)